ncbi:MAG: ribosome maturation factor RimP [Epsilonproteobacteria bacterium]|nr:ribosome maturation factor RimP [Campylobacterota bacterium]
MELKDVIKNIVEDNGCELYDIELAKEGDHTFYRVYITKPGGVSLEDCGAINNLLSPIFDVEEPVKGRYFLEVSSPGVERKLSKKEHFQKSVGERVKLNTSDGKVKGMLTYADDEIIKVDDKEIKYDDIKKAKTYVDWSKYKFQ